MNGVELLHVREHYCCSSFCFHQGGRHGGGGCRCGDGGVVAVRLTTRVAAAAAGDGGSREKLGLGFHFGRW